MATYDLTQTIPAASDLATGDILNCTYTGAEINITLPAGKYKIEAYGAAGATNTRNTSFTGGEGGYSYGTISFTSETSLYLNAGGTGGSGGSSSATKNAEGYNGGGYSYYYAGSGGGATHVATTSGLLASLENNKDAIIIVAGGGGGSAAYSSSSSSSYCGYGGKGGGESGQAGSYGSSYTNTRYAGQGGTQSAGGATGTTTSRSGTAGSFGQGGHGGTASNSYYGEGGGGGGYYGGGGAGGVEAGGGGGSGYLSSSLTDSATSQGGNAGNGYITITIIEVYSSSHTISFYDGTLLLGQVETEGNEKITLPTAPTKNGYKFIGYFLADGTTQIKEDIYETSKPTSDIICYATYEKYSITFYVEDSIISTISTTGKETIAFPNNPTKDGYDFINWVLSDGTAFNQAYLDNNYLTEDLKVYAAFRQKFTVKFICDGTTYKEVQSSGFESITAPTTTPTKDGYTFQGWFINESYTNAYTESYFLNKQITADTTIYGQLTEDISEEPENKSNVNFYVNNKIYYTFSTKGKESIVMPDSPAIKDYTFIGWYADKACSIEVTSSYLLNRWIDKDISVYAKLQEVEKFSVNYIINNKIYYTYKSAGNEVFKQPSNPNISNYSFQGWYWDSSYSNKYDASKYVSTALTSNLLVYGKMVYTKKNNINFYLTTDTTETYAVINTTGGEVITLPTNPTAEVGYEFKGWFLDKKLTQSFNSSYYETHYLTKDINVYALFETSSTGPFKLEIEHSGNGKTDPDVGTYTITKGTTTSLTITPTTDNFKYLEINGEIVDCEEAADQVTPTNAVAYFPFNSDSSDTLGRSTTSTSGTPSINTSTVKFGTGSIYFGGSAYLKIELPESFSNEFTVECWFYTNASQTSGTYPCLLSTDGSCSYGNIYFAINDGSYSAYPVCRANSASGTNNGEYGSTQITAGIWHHFAYSRSSSNNYYFLDGSLIATVTQSNPQEVSALYLGTLYRNSSSSIGSSDYYTGYIDDLLISSGCKYSAAFTVPTAAYNAQKISKYTYTIEDQSENIKAIAYFGALEDFAITSSAEDGTITPEGETVLTEGSIKTYQAKGNSNQEIKAFLVDGVAVDTIKTGTKTYNDAICLCTFDEDIKDDLAQCTITTNGSPSISTDQSKFGGASLYLNGSSYLKISLPSTYSDGFTVECWFYTTKANTSNSYPTPVCWGQGTAYGQTYMHVDDGSYSTYAVCRSNKSTSSEANGGYDDTSTAITRNEWHHLAISRTTSSCYFFIDGTLRKTVSNSSPVTVSEVDIGALVGASVDSKTYFTGYIDELVIYPSTIYSSAFTVPTEAYELTLTDIVYEYTLKNIHSNKTIRAVFSPLLYLKAGKNWKGISKVYKKVSGTWVEQTSSDLQNIFSTEENYAQGTYNPTTK